jgi:methylated-DNA-[protein]-cysteine S-methyltransferase
MASDLILRFATTETPLGPFTVVTTERGVLATTSSNGEVLVGDLSRRYRAIARRGGAVVSAASAEIRRYFAGALRTFETPIDPTMAPTPLTAAMWRTARSIPYGELCTYGDLAARAGAPGAARAAGAAMRRCPVELFVPCHRVVRSGPGFGGYGGDDGRRVALLRLEGVVAAGPTG